MSMQAGGENQNTIDALQPLVNRAQGARSPYCPAGAFVPDVTKVNYAAANKWYTDSNERANSPVE